MKERLFVDIHVIETLPPSCVNRDDLGSPKTAVYGGVTRARVSSQAWKRAVRMEFEQMQVENGKRTKHLEELLTDEILKLAPQNEKAQELADFILSEINIKLDKDHKSKALFFISPAQLKALAKVALRYGIIKKPPKNSDGQKIETYNTYLREKDAAIRENASLDVALFGRMLADDPSLNLDAAAQVAHAISTHEVHNEFDYYTAVDDKEGTVGAGHLGTMEFNASTMYRYATVNPLELEKSLGNETACGVRKFVEAFIRSMPTGKQNSYANRVRPDAIYVTVRKDQPVNMAGAFEKPVKAGKEGYVEPTLRCLREYAEETYRDYYDQPALALSVGLEGLGEKTSLNGLLDTLEAYLEKQLAEGETK